MGWSACVLVQPTAAGSDKPGVRGRQPQRSKLARTLVVCFQPCASVDCPLSNATLNMLFYSPEG